MDDLISRCLWNYSAELRRIIRRALLDYKIHVDLLSKDAEFRRTLVAVRAADGPALHSDMGSTGSLLYFEIKARIRNLTYPFQDTFVFKQENDTEHK